jgi:hypothetical protein
MPGKKKENIGTVLMRVNFIILMMMKIIAVLMMRDLLNFSMIKQYKNNFM